MSIRAMQIWVDMRLMDTHRWPCTRVDGLLRVEIRVLDGKMGGSLGRRRVLKQALPAFLWLLFHDVER